ncbi:MAG: hypothetical protein ACKOYM_10895 [Actinomycetes bacterium]
MTVSERRGVVPGSFHPLTIAHIALGVVACDALQLDGIDLSVSQSALGKGHLDDSAVERVEAVSADIRDHPTWRAVTTPAKLLSEIAAPYDALVIGADKLAQLLDPKWYEHDDQRRDDALRQLPVVAVAPRAGTDLDALLERADLLDIVVLDTPPHLRTVSATAVRAGRTEWKASA